MDCCRGEKFPHQKGVGVIYSLIPMEFPAKAGINDTDPFLVGQGPDGPLCRNRDIPDAVSR